MLLLHHLLHHLLALSHSLALARSVSVASGFVTVRVALWLLSVAGHRSRKGRVYGSSLCFAWAAVTNFAMRVSRTPLYLLTGHLPLISDY